MRFLKIKKIKINKKTIARPHSPKAKDCIFAKNVRYLLNQILCLKIILKKSIVKIKALKPNNNNFILNFI